MNRGQVEKCRVGSGIDYILCKTIRKLNDSVFPTVDRHRNGREIPNGYHLPWTLDIGINKRLHTFGIEGRVEECLNCSQVE
jgi:hypothetical protein